MTREVQLQQQLEEQEMSLRQNQKLEAMGTLAGGIAHDFNNILAAVMGYTELCFEEAELGSELHENLTEVLAASNRAKELVKQILTFSRQGDEEKKPINLCPLVRDAVKMLRSTTPTNIELDDKLLGSRAIVNGNASQLNQILVNLVTNAVHAIDDNGKIELAIEQVAVGAMTHGHLLGLKPGNYAKLSVADDGRGIAKEYIDTIFDPYFTTKPPEKGTGLGLAVVHGIVTSHLGYIDVVSNPGQGTIFEIFLPLSQLRERSKPVPDKVVARRGNENILVVDDERAIAKIHQRSLERLGYSVSVFLDSRDALEKVKEDPHQFSLIITDMTMPGLNGLQFAQAVKNINSDIFVVLCTGYSEDINPENWQSTVLDALFMKPVRNDELATTIRKLLDVEV